MDAQAHLLSLGWAGPGHALDARPSHQSQYQQKGHRGLAYDPKQVRATSGGNGLVKPLLISQRQARLGVGGKKAHEPQAGNEWWLKGFESALGNIGKSESERTSGASTPNQEVLNRQNGKHGGLYSFFVKGQEMVGSISDCDGDVPRLKSKKRKSDVLDETEDCKATSGTTSLLRKKKDPSVEFEQVGQYLAVRDKDKSRRSREESNKAGVLEQFQQVGEFFEAAEGSKKRKKRRKSEVIDDVKPESMTVPAASTKDNETKEERRERRRKRREEKEAVKLSGTNGTTRVVTSEQTEEEAAAAKAARKAERKRRKAELAATSGQTNGH